jgi:hypothetical protein
MDGEGDTADPETVVEEEPAPEKKRKENQSEEASASDDFLVTSEDQRDGSSDCNGTVGEEQSTKRSPHTLANLNFKVKKGKNLLKLLSASLLITIHQYSHSFCVTFNVNFICHYLHLI